MDTERETAVTTDPENVDDFVQPRQSPVRVVFVDFSGVITPKEMNIDPTTSYHAFLASLTSLTAPVAHVLPNLAVAKVEGQGFTLADGPWLYRIVKPANNANLSGGFDRADNHDFADATKAFSRNWVIGTGLEEWNMLNSLTAFTRMIDRLSYGYYLEGAWIEVQHFLQKQRDELSLNVQRSLLHPVALSYTDIFWRANIAPGAGPTFLPTGFGNQSIGAFGEPPGGYTNPLIINGGRDRPGFKGRTTSRNPGQMNAPADLVYEPNLTWEPPKRGRLVAPGLSPTAPPFQPQSMRMMGSDFVDSNVEPEAIAPKETDEKEEKRQRQRSARAARARKRANRW